MEGITITGREEYFLAKVAGEDVSDVEILAPTAVSVKEKLLEKIAERLGDAEDAAEDAAITPASAIADLTDAPTKEDFNALLAALRTAGIIKTA